MAYASQRVWNDKDFVLPVISEYPMELQYLSEELSNCCCFFLLRA
ncbi:DUF4116 domain-containing protein [Endozoicomonas sp. 8E]